MGEFFFSGFLSLNGFSKNLSIFFLRTDDDAYNVFCYLYGGEMEFSGSPLSSALSQRPADGNLTGRIFLIIAITHRIVIPGAIFHKDQYVHWRDVRQAIFSKVNFIKVQPCLASVSLALDQKGWLREIRNQSSIKVKFGYPGRLVPRS